MILLTIGTQLPFDRLVQAVDELAPNLTEPVFGQIGIEARYRPSNFEFCLTIKPSDMESRLKASRIVVSHAGIGTVLSSRRHRKPLVVVPRRARFGEHRNDHQLATCTQLAGKTGIYVVEEPKNLADFLRRNLAGPEDGTVSRERLRLMEGIRNITQSWL